MCYHASLGATYAQLEDHYDRPFLDQKFPSFTSPQDVVGYHLNGFNHPLMPVITADNPDCLQLFRWGLIPSWAKDFKEADELRKLTLNAKSETVNQKPAFRNVIQKKRCLIPVTGFFEWKEMSSSNKTPYFIHIKNQAIFSLAGIYDRWENEAEENTVYQTFSILTTQANQLMADIHRKKLRMPVILNQQQENTWIKQSLTQGEINSCFEPFSVENMEAWTISKLIGSRKDNSNVSEVIEPFSYEKRDLFS